MLSQSVEKMFLAIYKITANSHNLNNYRYAAYLKSSTKIKADLSSIPTKRAAARHSFSKVFLFVAPIMVPIPLEEELEFELDEIVEKYDEI
ncbi:hypothetical protein AVEN_120452-1 [Araneus ventricosus]|uniref:Uncharacterized protein n=1 Tax=Araneus ventricosus TaxID=182803 RepID=A0A4Y2WBS5_ARAVE|nr:hypothetical protein AVEN_120452-1 [Araneus ventricosus]